MRKLLCSSASKKNSDKTANNKAHSRFVEGPLFTILHNTLIFTHVKNVACSTAGNLITHADDSRGNKAFSGVCVSVSVCVCVYVCVYVCVLST